MDQRNSLVVPNSERFCPFNFLCRLDQGDRMWSFAVPLLLAKMFNGLLPSSLFATVSQLACVIFGSYVGGWIDRNNRLKLMQTALIIQNISVVTSFVLLITLHYKYSHSGRIDAPWKDLLFVVLFLLSILFGSISAVASMITSLSITKEWIVIIQKARPHMPLPKVNATFRRIDLACKLLAPVAFALVLQFAGLTKALIIAASWNALSLIPESILTQTLYRLVPELAIPKTVDHTKAGVNPISEIISGWKTYFRQGIFRSSIAYVLLYLTVLSPGGVMTAYLEFQNMPEVVIAVFTAFGALVGLLATFVAPHLIEKFKLRRTGAYSLWCQFTILLFSLIPFLGNTSVYILCISVALSRLGLWSFDLVEVQLVQTYVDEAERGVVSGVEYAMANLISVFSYALGIFIPDPKDFLYLVIISLVAVGSAMLIYTHWYLYPPREVLQKEAQINAAEMSEIDQNKNDENQVQLEEQM